MAGVAVPATPQSRPEDLLVLTSSLGQMYPRRKAASVVANADEWHNALE
jgi:hypothetical protein